MEKDFIVAKPIGCFLEYAADWGNIWVLTLRSLESYSFCWQFTGFGILAYIVLAVIAPLEETQKNDSSKVLSRRMPQDQGDCHEAGK